MKIWKWERYFYFIILKKPLTANRLAAIKQGKAWLRVKGTRYQGGVIVEGVLLQNTDPSKEGDRCQPETCAGQCQGMNSRPECPNLFEEERKKWKKSEEEKK